MAEITPELIETLLIELARELSTDSGPVSHLLAATICGTPEAELLAAGRTLIESEAANRRILGTLLLRELKGLAGQATEDLASVTTWRRRSPTSPPATCRTDPGQR